MVQGALVMKENIISVLEGLLVKLMSRYWDTIISINIQHVEYVNTVLLCFVKVIFCACPLTLSK